MYELNRLLQTALGVDSFFHQYGELEGEMTPTLLVMNGDYKKITTSRNIKRLHLYLATVNAKVFYHETIWYAIIPELPLLEKPRSTLTRKRFDGSKQEEEDKELEIYALRELFQCLTEHRIQMFFSNERSEERRVGKEC